MQTSTELRTASPEPRFCMSDYLVSTGSTTPKTVRSLVVGVVEAGEPGRETFYGGLELGEGVHELLEPVGDPGERDLLVAPPRLELLDAPVGEVHRPSGRVRAQENACWMSAFCSSTCIECWPTE